ncbi:MAG: nucleotide sugar dehydrogenase [Anaerolineaceae bacterium]|nr:nucleotide sugar dehydrogenase [Anaerolineaceae bacterium]
MKIVEFQTLCVLGLGYIGLPTASTFATHGIKVIGVDTNPSIIESLNNGKIHLFEPGLRTLVQAAIRSGNLIVKSQPQPADAFIIAVPTPFKEGKQADLSYIQAAAESITQHLKKGNLVILESTSPPRTTVDIVVPLLEKSGLTAGKDFFLAYSPERVLPGQILRELIENARVIGGIDEASAQAGKALYSTFVRGEIILTDATTAEMVKLMENTYRDINIAAANEFARIAERFHVDIWEAIKLANRHPRVEILNPGPGVGGHCISVDPWFFVEAAPDITDLIHTARKVNDSQPQYVLNFLQRKIGNIKGKIIAALGLAYKPNVDDLRESPAVKIVQLLRDAGAEVHTFEPFDPSFTFDGVKPAQSLEEALMNVDCIILLVAHSQLIEIDPSQLIKKISACAVLDTVNGWDGTSWNKAGFNYFRLGDGRH